MAVDLTNPAPAHSSRSVDAGRGAAPSGAYTYIVTDAGALQVGDVVFWHRETITEIHRQTESSCDCTLVAQDGTIRRHTINSVNGLIVVVGGPTLAAANQHTNLKLTRVGQPIYRKTHETTVTV